MAGKYFPFRSEAGDRKYSAEDWAAYFALFIGNGVFYSSADKLKVAEDNGMKVKVQKGAGFIAGRMYLLEENTTITLDTADGALNRIDRIVLRCDYANRLMTVTAKKGSYSENPTAPELTRNADVYELALADIYVSAGVIEITAANITDQRLNTSLCGIVTGLVEQADTTEIFNQFSAYLEDFKQISGKDFDEQLNEWNTEIITWFDEIRAALEGDIAIALATRIIALENGETAAGNADKLDGHGSEYFATTEDVITLEEKYLPKTGGRLRTLTMEKENDTEEGGHITLERATQSTLEEDVCIDTVNDHLRIFEGGGGFRGVILDIAACSSLYNNYLLHTGNSAMVKIQEATPDDTTGNVLHVW